MERTAQTEVDVHRRLDWTMPTPTPMQKYGRSQLKRPTQKTSCVFFLGKDLLLGDRWDNLTQCPVLCVESLVAMGLPWALRSAGDLGVWVCPPAAKHCSPLPPLNLRGCFLSDAVFPL